MSNEPSQEPIRLELGQTADPNTCGSCKFFERTEIWNMQHGGYCGVTLPPWLAKKEWDGEGMPPTRVDDRSRCDLYRHTGKTYIASYVVRSS